MVADDDAIYSGSTEPAVQVRLLIRPRRTRHPGYPKRAKYKAGGATEREVVASIDDRGWRPTIDPPLVND